MKTVQVGKKIKIGKGTIFCLVAGPCVIETRDLAMKTAEKIKEIGETTGIQVIYKSSFDKANRSSIDSFRGPGLQEGLRILQEVKETFDIPICSDIHNPDEALPASEVCDIVQIPAFLCRQTDLVIAAAKTKATIKVKKGQLMAPEDMANVVHKIESCGNHNIILTDRGTCFGYHNLVTDIRAIPAMQNLGYPVCFDATHSVQLPGGNKTQSGGQREFIPPLTKAALAAGANLLFMETHPDPKNAKSDKHSVYPLDELKQFIQAMIPFYELGQKSL